MFGKELTDLMSASDCFLLFKHDDYPNSFPTKFFEYISFRKPLICYSALGEVTNEISENDLGVNLNDKSTVEDLIVFFNKMKQNKFNTNYNYNKFSITYNVDLIEKHLPQ